MSMKAVVFQGENEVAIEDVDEPEIEHPNDVLIDITTSAICGQICTCTRVGPRPSRESFSGTRISLVVHSGSREQLLTYSDRKEATESVV